MDHSSFYTRKELAEFLREDFFNFLFLLRCVLPSLEKGLSVDPLFGQKGEEKLIFSTERVQPWNPAMVHNHRKECMKTHRWPHGPYKNISA